MDALAIREQKKYLLLWDQISAYRRESNSEILSTIFLALFQERIHSKERVIDFGCGTGRSVFPLINRELRVDLVDFCPNCLDPLISWMILHDHFDIRFFPECLWNLSHAIQPAEWILCLDVLEHIPSTKVQRVLSAIFTRMQKGGLIAISTRPDRLGKMIQQKLHLTIRPASWWRTQVSAYCSIVSEFEEENALILVVETAAH